MDIQVAKHVVLRDAESLCTEVSRLLGRWRIDPTQYAHEPTAQTVVTLCRGSAGLGVFAEELPGIASAGLRARYRLTPTQTQVALLLARRWTNREIAVALAISVHTVRKHVEAVLLRLAVSSRVDVRSHVFELVVDGRL